MTVSPATGYISGTLADPVGAQELLRTAELSLHAAERLNCPRLNVHGTGLDDQGLPVLPITMIVQPCLRSACASTSSSHVSIAVGSSERSQILAITSFEGAR